ncbi:MAG: hypothetical protein Q4P20_00320 [Eubacteriales bacterium]|nr:hypothetical protein [Eubacteriales bacterium]
MLAHILQISAYTVNAARGAFGVMERKRGHIEESPENHRFFGVEGERREGTDVGSLSSIA